MKKGMLKGSTGENQSEKARSIKVLHTGIKNKTSLSLLMKFNQN